MNIYKEKGHEEIKSSLLKLISTTLLIVLAVVLLLLFVITYILKVNSSRENMRYKLDFAYYQVNNEFNNMLNSAVNITGSQLVMELLSHDGEYPVGEMMEDYRLLGKFIGGFINSGESGSRDYCIYVHNPAYVEGTYILHTERLKKSGLFDEIEKLHPYEMLWRWDEDGSRIRLFKRIYGSEDLGVLEVSISSDKIKRILSEISLNGSEGIAVINDSSDVIASDGNFMQKHSLRVKKTFENNMSIVVTEKMSGVVKSVIFMFLLISVPIAVLLFAVLQTYKYMLTKITDRLYSFVHKLQEEDGNEIDVENNDEIGFIEARFKEVYNRNKELYKNLEEINKEKNKMEIKFLQYSLNPHLLYNSLSVVKWLLVDKGENEITDVIDSMVSYYRLVLSEGQEVITIRQEVELLRKYIDIVEMTYRCKIRMSVNIDEQILDSCIIKMILQPFVENAAMHGLVGRENPQLDISCKEKDGMLLFEISDNGNGIDAKTLESIKGDNFKRRKRGFGLKNTRKRIEMYYGSDCSFDIESKEGEGTTVRIVLKKIDNNSSDS